jgi:hypothetical protein
MASVTPGIHSTSQPVSNHPADFMHTVLPEISQSDPEPEVQVVCSDLRFLDL